MRLTPKLIRCLIYEEYEKINTKNSQCLIEALNIEEKRLKLRLNEIKNLKEK